MGSSSSIRAMACFATCSVDTEETGRCFRRIYIVLDSFVCLPLCLSADLCNRCSINLTLSAVCTESAECKGFRVIFKITDTDDLR